MLKMRQNNSATSGYLWLCLVRVSWTAECRRRPSPMESRHFSGAAAGDDRGWVPSGLHDLEQVLPVLLLDRRDASHRGRAPHEGGEELRVAAVARARLSSSKS